MPSHEVGIGAEEVEGADQTTGCMQLDGIVVEVVQALEQPVLRRHLPAKTTTSLGSHHGFESTQRSQREKRPRRERPQRGQTLERNGVAYEAIVVEAELGAAAVGPGQRLRQVMKEV